MYKGEGGVKGNYTNSEALSLKKWRQGAATRNQTQRGPMHKNYLIFTEGGSQPTVTLRRGAERIHTDLTLFLPSNLQYPLQAD